MTDHLQHDIDPQETREWLDALEVVLEEDGAERGHFLLETLIEKARRSGAFLPYTATTAYLNTIPTSQEPTVPGDHTIEARIRAAIRWNSVATFLVLPHQRCFMMSVSTISSAPQLSAMVATFYLSKATCRQVFMHVHF